MDVIKVFLEGVPTMIPEDGEVIQNIHREYAHNTTYGWRRQVNLAHSTSLLVIAMDAEAKPTILQTI